jgi:CxxC motif-containing protein (DUF1111 family)
MVRMIANWVVVFPLSLGCMLLVAAVGAAQTGPQDDSDAIAGRQIFERQWKWIEPAERASDPSQGDSPAGKKRHRRLLVAAALAPEEIESERVALGDGLGPLHNARSCAECHPGGGGSGVEHNVLHLTVDPRSQVVKRTDSGAATLRELFPGLLETDGALLFDVLVHDRSTRSGYREIRAGLAQHVPGGIDEAWFVPEKRTVEALARRPVVAGRHEDVDYYLSQRNSPALFGLGRIEAIPPAKILEVAARQPEQSGGAVTGRFVGKFGWRGQGQSVAQVVSEACAVELGLAHDNPLGSTSSTRAMLDPLRASLPQLDDPADPAYANLGLDMTRQELRELTAYVSSLARPVEQVSQEPMSKELLTGEKLFVSAGCSVCHVADLHPVQGLFSDLLIHDMGPGLQAPSPAPLGLLRAEVKASQPPTFKVDNPKLPPARASYYGTQTAALSIPIAAKIARPDQPRFPRGEAADDDFTWDALQREWRTPPLWGVADTAPYLHDGRAATLQEAIMWHGGEGASAKERFAALSQADKDLVLLFLSSLRSPQRSN